MVYGSTTICWGTECGIGGRKRLMRGTDEVKGMVRQDFQTMQRVDWIIEKLRGAAFN